MHMLIYLYGTNTYGIQGKTQQFVAKFEREVDQTGMNIVNYDGAHVTPSDITQSVFSQGLFVQKRMIIIKDISTANRDKESIETFVSLFEKLIAEKNDNIVIVLDRHVDVKKGPKGARKGSSEKKLFETLCNAHYAFPFPELDRSQLRSWAQSRAQLHGVSLSLQDSEYFVSNIGSDQWLLANELEKIIHYTLSQGEVTVSRDFITLLTKQDFQEKIFALLDTLIAGDTKKLLSLLNLFYEKGDDPHYIFSMIVWQFRIILNVASARNEQPNTSHTEIAKYIGVHPFVVQKVLKTVNKRSFDEIKSIYRKLADLDRKIKTGYASPELLIETFALSTK